ncbi:NUMOD4 domain-containing protein [Salegentibacter flavus]|uniref:HNH endonuclease n=1 Tax=Salegentibacter flavus TaxID=287099 RepID=A0A1I4Z3U6_9FLAO|nr:NUMOD4 domain-containing protein [Salegentibacter flavus]SFN44956.1 HNH endonuclease [Salegentibacter flavus]
MNEEQELWVKIKGFENRYMISNRGRILSLGRVMTAKDGFIRNYPDRILKLKPHKNTGYCLARLYHHNGKTYEDFSVHRLVALHFLENSENLPVVNHIDTNRSNNHVDNLEWVTVAENLTHHGCHLRGGEKRKKKVFQYTDIGEFIRAWNSVQEAHDAGYNMNMVRKVCLGYRKRYRGFVWSYK